MDTSKEDKTTIGISRNQRIVWLVFMATLMILLVLLVIHLQLQSQGSGAEQVVAAETSPVLSPTAATAAAPLIVGSGNLVLTDTPTPFQPATLTPLPSPTLTPSATATPVLVDGRHVVRPGDTLERIAAQFHISIDLLRDANAMDGDAILPGQQLILPGPDETVTPRWRYAGLDKDLSDVDYPLVYDAGRFRMHYVAGTYPAVDPQAVSAMILRGMEHVEKVLGKPLPGTFDVYVAGHLYIPPNRYLRGRSFSKEWKVFFLHDGSGDAINQQYLAAHEMTHLYAWNTFGEPYSFLVSEGAAVYVGMKMIADSRYLPIQTFCAAYLQEGQLPRITEKKEPVDFRGHANNLVNYYSAGCFVGYLTETYGVDKFAAIYSTHHFTEVYGKTLAQLEDEWRQSMAAQGSEQQVNAHRLVLSVDRFMQANRIFYDSFNATSHSLAAYRVLDKARLALLQGNFDLYDQWMDMYEGAQ